MSTPLLRTEQLGLTINDRQLLSQVSLSVHPGELVGVIGPNGAGKSSLLKTLVGLHQQSAGKIWLHEQPLSQYRAQDRAQHISYLAQAQEMSFAFRVRETIMLGAHSRVRTKHFARGQLDQELNRIVDLLDIASLLDRRLDQLSGGERQLVHFARMLMQDSPLMLLDEPTASLDIGHEAQLMNLLHQQCRQGRSALVAIHNLNSAAAFCDRLLLIQNGQLVAEGDPEQVITQATMKRMYGPSVLVSRNPMTGTTTVLPLVESQTPVPLHVHLIGGAGSTVALCRQLLQMGVRVTAGIGHDQDSDTQLWEALGVEHIKVPTFAPIETADIDAAKGLVQQADITVMTDFPIGTMNAGNLTLAEQARHLWLVTSGNDDSMRFYDDSSLQRFHALQQRANVKQITATELMPIMRQQVASVTR
ncbi:ABC transporter ATP-binding protein [Reinekea blandensis]|uniref:Vitamin B12 transport ATP-binding protein BtuD n=1 Tax=Reinekea blandensis MED297 TaxID=314283 RepID=A4BK54_9GAMM|nr:ABC transporter ATP-binding protein [Reinekea blandensis]EAR07483.1 vitamin B12 transport ATP-binding protein BtuD [Reinekea sp. MED297] [Reinekea blandensis MED297]